MEKEKEPSDKEAHEVCHNPCMACNKTGYLDNKDRCPACGGTGCKDKTLCVPAGGLACEP